MGPGLRRHDEGGVLREVDREQIDRIAIRRRPYRALVTKTDSLEQPRRRMVRRRNDRDDALHPMHIARIGERRGRGFARVTLRAIRGQIREPDVDVIERVRA